MRLSTLGVKFATTNYDGIIEEVIGSPPVTWKEDAKVERVIRDDDQAVLHLHGYWDQPESVILGIRSTGCRVWSLKALHFVKSTDDAMVWVWL